MKWRYEHGSSLIPLLHSVKPMLIELVYSTAGDGSSRLGQDGYVDLADTGFWGKSTYLTKPRYLPL